MLTPLPPTQKDYIRKNNKIGKEEKRIPLVQGGVSAEVAAGRAPHIRDRDQRAVLLHEAARAGGAEAAPHLQPLNLQDLHHDLLGGLRQHQDPHPPPQFHVRLPSQVRSL